MGAAGTLAYVTFLLEQHISASLTPLLRFAGHEVVPRSGNQLNEGTLHERFLNVLAADRQEAKPSPLETARGLDGVWNVSEPRGRRLR